MKNKLFIGLVCIVIFIGGFVFTKRMTLGISTPSKILYLFPRQHQYPDRELVKLINGAKGGLDIAIYSITKKNIVNAIISAARRGVKVRMISDKEAAQNEYQHNVLNRILSAGIRLKINSHRGLMHLKVSIIDNKIVTTGSYNYTDAATNENDEVMVVLFNTQIAKDFENEFNRMWEDNKNFEFVNGVYS